MRMLIVLNVIKYKLLFNNKFLSQFWVLSINFTTIPDSVCSSYIYIKCLHFEVSVRKIQV